MTLTMKSKARSTSNVGSIHGNTGPQDFRGMLDFARGDYYTVNASGVRQDIPLRDAINVTRTGGASFKDRMGVVQSVNANEPRFRYESYYDAYGLFVGGSKTNYLYGSADGSTADIPAAGGAKVFLAWEGSGELSLTGINVTLESSGTFGNTKIKVYTKDTTAAFSVTLNRTGSVDYATVEYNGYTERLGYRETIGTDDVKLGSAFTALLKSASSVFIRAVAMPHPTVTRSDQRELHAALPIGLRNGLASGGLYVEGRPKTNTGATNGVRYYPDNGAYVDSTLATSANGTARPQGMVYGVAYSNWGAEVDGVWYGMSNTATGLVALSPFNEISIGGISGVHPNLPGRVQGVITHAVIYDRRLPKDELAAMATMWQS